MNHARQDTAKPALEYRVMCALLALFFLQAFVSALIRLLSPDSLDDLPDIKRDFILDGPLWWRLALVVTTGGATLGWLLLLFRSQYGLWCFFLAFAGAFVYFFYEYALADVIGVFGYDSLFEPLMVFSLLSLSTWYAIYATRVGHLR